MKLYEYDFNIDNYSIRDLENFLNLDKNYAERDITEKESIIRSKLFQALNDDNAISGSGSGSGSGSVSKNSNANIERQMISFLEEAKRLLIEKFNKNTLLSSGSDTMIIDKSKKDSLTHFIEPITTVQTSHLRGNLNQLKKRVSTYTLCFNTLFRDPKGSSLTDSLFTLPYSLKNVLSLKLTSMEFPETIYLLSDKKKTNRMFIREDNTCLEELIVIPEGKYDSESLPFALQDAINTTLSSGARFTVMVDSITGKTTIANTENTFSVYFMSDLDTNAVLSKNIGWLLGYRNSHYTNVSNLVSESIFTPIPLQYIYFVLNDFSISNSNTIMAIFGDTYVEKNILAKIPVAVDNFQVLFDNNSDLISKKREYFGPIDISKFSVKILDHYGEVVDINNMNYSFTLELDVAYDI